jgi:hypothetical protein
MKKLKLDLDDLRVDSFDTTPAAAAGERGTVHGQYPETYRGCNTDEETCDSCFGSCGDTCGYSCNGTCGTCAESCNGTCNTCYTNCGSCPGQWSCDPSCYSCCDTCDYSCGGSCDNCTGTCPDY